MSIISIPHFDHSEALCGRFAVLVSRLLDQPNDAQAPGNSIPLENLFRVLQMFRYDAFSDERRSGVLAFNNEDSPGDLPNTETWHLRLEKALDESLDTAFEGTPKVDAIREVQQALRWLATSNAEPSAQTRERAKRFFEALSEKLA